MLQKVLSLIFGSKNERDIKKLLPIVNQIHTWENKITALTDEELTQQTNKFKEKIKQAISLEEILPEAFMTVQEAAWRRLGIRHFDVQMIGALVLHHGQISEMKTGEGKTLTSTAVAYLNALKGKGVHIVTVNDYLAERDANWMKPIYDILDIKVGILQHSMDYNLRQDAYMADITYGTNSEFGFDYLRDNMLGDKEERVQRGFHFAIVDEVDSILIDEARTPLIISGPTEENTNQYNNMNRAIITLIDAEKKLPEPDPVVVQPGKEEPHIRHKNYYDIDEKSRSVFLTEEGVHKLEEIFKIENLFSHENTELVAHSSQALRAHLIFKKEVDYVVQNGEVVLVDEHTGRTMPGRRYGDGLHQAIEAKERVEVKQESQTLASVTYQNFFRQYKKLSGMTGTADTEAEEFKKIYKLDVVVIPTNLPVKRIDHPDRIYCSENEKYDAIVKEVKECREKGQPVLVGTISIEKSEFLSNLLKKAGLEHNVLNARHHAREAEIIANAGKINAITVATNMAGRGTDIVLGGTPEYLAEIDAIESEGNTIEIFRNHMLKKQFTEAKKNLVQYQKDRGEKKQLLKDIYNRSQNWLTEHGKVKDAGGLHILGTERHESRRIDNQLRGRAGRQGDPGSSRFYLSLEDHLMRIFGGERIKNIMSRIGMQEGQELEASMVDRAIARAQKRVEGHNFDIRKHLLEYDEVMNKQREFIYGERNRLLENENVQERLQKWIEETVEIKIIFYCESNDVNRWDLEAFNQWLQADLGLHISLDISEYHRVSNPQLSLFKKVYEEVYAKYQEKSKQIGKESFNYIERRIALDVIDARWKEHLHHMDQLREGVWVSGYAERNPLVEFKLKGFELFDRMVEAIKEQVTEYLLRVKIEGPLEIEDDEGEEKPAQSFREKGKGKGNPHHQSYNSFDSLEVAQKGEAMPPPFPTTKTQITNATTFHSKVDGTSRRRTSRRRKKR